MTTIYILFAIIVAILFLNIAVDIRAARVLNRFQVLHARARLDGDHLLCACHLSADDDTPPCRPGCRIVRVFVDGRREP